MLARALVLAAAAGLIGSAPASATTRCAGEQRLLYVCLVTPPLTSGSTTYCVYTGGSSCTPVSVPNVNWTGAWDVTCEGMLAPTSC